MGTMMSRG